MANQDQAVIDTPTAVWPLLLATWLLFTPHDDLESVFLIFLTPYAERALISTKTKSSLMPTPLELIRLIRSRVFG